MSMIKTRIKPFILAAARAINRLFEWVVVPVYAKVNHLSVHRIGVRLVVASPVYREYDSQSESMYALDAVVEALKENNIPYFVYSRGYYRKSVVVMTEHRDKALRLVSQSHRLKHHYYVLEKEKYNTHIEKIIGLLSPMRNKKNKDVLAISLYRNISLAGKRCLLGRDTDTRVEFWSKPEDLSSNMVKRTMAESGIMTEAALEGSIIAPVSNGIVKVVDSSDQEEDTIELGGKSYPTIKMFTKDFLHEINFPIDIVYTWVDGSDAAWLDKYEKARQEHEPDYKNNSMSRYTDHDELRYSLRSVQMFAPWARNIYIITDNQTPSWFNDKQDKVKIISHKDIFKDPSALPVFNSHAIESQLHHIPGLSEHYIYINDDIILAKPVTPDTFFFPNGIAKTQPSLATIGSGAPSVDESAPSSAGKNARDIVSKYTGKYITNKYRHTAYPQIKSVAFDLEEKESEIYDKTMRSKFRSTQDIPFASILMQSYMTASGTGVPISIPVTTVDVSQPNSDGIMKRLLNGQHPYITICLNESVTDKGAENLVDDRVRGFLKDFMPIPSRYELGDE